MTSLIITLTEKVRPAIECEKKAFHFIVQLLVLISVTAFCHCNCQNVTIPKRLPKCLAVVMTKEKKWRGERKKKEKRASFSLT
jgi:hypothetical protein